MEYIETPLFIERFKNLCFKLSLTHEIHSDVFGGSRADDKKIIWKGLELFELLELAYHHLKNMGANSLYYSISDEEKYLEVSIFSDRFVNNKKGNFQESSVLGIFKEDSFYHTELRTFGNVKVINIYFPYER